MAKCKWCGKGGWLTSVDSYGLCQQCSITHGILIPQYARIAAESLKILMESKNLSTRLSRYDIAVEHLNTLLQYERKGITTTGPTPPSELIRHAMVIRQEAIKEAAQSYIKTAQTKASAAATWRSRVSAIEKALQQALELRQAAPDHPSVVQAVTVLKRAMNGFQLRELLEKAEKEEAKGKVKQALERYQELLYFLRNDAFDDSEQKQQIRRVEERIADLSRHLPPSRSASPALYVPAITEPKGSVRERTVSSIPVTRLDPNWGHAAFVDVETTGFSPVEDDIIEVAVVLFAFTRDTYEVMGVVDRYVGRQEPEADMSPFAQRVHGIGISDLAGQELDREALVSILRRAEFLVAHNAQFDRAFLRAEIPAVEGMRWYCSLRGIDWAGHGFDSRRLRDLTEDHGLGQAGEFHRADDDCLLAINLLAQSGAEHTYLYELVHQAELTKQRQAVDRLERAARPKTTRSTASGVLSGQTIVVTGTMSRWTREEIEDLIESLGGRASSSVSKKTTLVVAGPGAGSKLTRATELGIRVVGEVEFLKLVASGG